jgi:CRISPR-associated Csh1 family protein
VRIDGKYLGELEELRDLLDEEAYTKYYEKSKGRGTCSLSHEEDVAVWGRIDTLGFTVNDISFNRGGFDGKASYRMFPVSKPAALALEAARRFAFAKLTDRFYTLEYLVVPRLIEGRPEDLLRMAKRMSVSKNDDTLVKKATPLLKAGGLIEVLAEEGLLQETGALFDILFYERKQAQLALQLHLQDVSPSRLQFVKQTIERTNVCYGKAFGYRNKEKQFVDFRIHFGVVKNFFSEGKGLKVRFDPAFFRILEGVFYGQSLDEATVVAALTRKIREGFKNDGDDYHLPFRTTVQQAIATRSLLGRLGLFDHQSYTIMEEQQSPITLRREAYIREHAGFFEKQPALKGAFLLGCLTSMLTYAQYDHLKSKPFLNKLNNLNLGLDELRALSAPLLNKIQEYQSRSGGYAPSHTETTNILSKANSLLITGKKPSRDDLSFAFSTGLVMQDKFGMDRAKERKEAGATSIPD